MTIEKLIAALEAAAGPIRELEFWCWWWGKAVHDGELPDADYVRDNMRNNDSPRYTASIDAALTLVPDGWDPALWMLDRWRGKSKVRLVARDGQEIHVNAMTAPIALCIAALKARKETP